ncbi:MAG: hypothetical protein C4335_09370 [Armatimonadota bacterium]
MPRWVLWYTAGLALVLLGVGAMLWIKGGAGAERLTLAQAGAVRDRNALSVAISADNRFAAVTCMRGPALVYHLPDLKQVASLPPKEKFMIQVAFHPSKKMLAAAELASGVSLWDTATWKRSAFLTTPGTAASVAFSPDGSWLAADVGADGWCLVVWKLDTRQEVYRFRAQGTSMFGPGFGCVTFIDNRTLAAGGLDGCVYIWDLGTGKQLGRWCVHRQPIASMAVLQRGALLASGSLGRTVVLLDWRRGEQLAVLPGVVVAASDDGKILAVASDTQPVMLQLWDVGTMRLLASRNVAQNILGMGFLSGGKGLVTVGNPETLVVWRILR